MINIRDALDFLERAKVVSEKCLSKDGSIDYKYWAFRSVELLPELIAEVERLQDLIDKPPEEADWVEDYHLLQSALDGPIIDAARKWHAAYRKAQNSNLMRAKEVERLRAALAHELDLRNRHIESLETRIKELEAHEQQTHEILGKILGNDDSLETVARKAITKIERLEAAFLEAEAAAQYYEGCLLDCQADDGPAFFGWPGRDYQAISDKSTIDMYRKEASEALEGIKEGGRDEN